jgi:hypothetical protein
VTADVSTPLPFDSVSFFTSGNLDICVIHLHFTTYSRRSFYLVRFIVDALDATRCRHEIKANNRWEDAGFNPNDARNNIRVVYKLGTGTMLTEDQFEGDARPLIIAKEEDLECPSIVFSLTKDDDKSNYGVVKCVTNAWFGVPNQVRSCRRVLRG